MATLNSGTTSTVLTGTAGASYLLGATGTFDGAKLYLEASNASTPTEYGLITEAEFFSPFFSCIALPSTNLRATIVKPGGITDTSIKIELTAVV